MSAPLLIASLDAERRRRVRALLADWPCYEAASAAELPRLIAQIRPALLLLDPGWPAGGAERAGLIELRLDETLLGLRERVAALLAAPPAPLQ